MKPNKQPVVYISAPFRAEKLIAVYENIKYANEKAKEALAKGWAPFVPHTNIASLWGADVANTYDSAVDDGIVAYNLNMLAACDKIWVCGTRRTKGMEEEIKFCKEAGIEIIYEYGPQA